jgi:hypothetical protein
MEGSIVPSKCNSRAQLGPQVILEGRSGKGSPRIKNGSHHLKLTDKMEAERRRGGDTERWCGSTWLTLAQGAVSEGFPEPRQAKRRELRSPIGCSRGGKIRR